MQSLRDKLLAAGVVSKDQADKSKAKEEADKARKAAARHGGGHGSSNSHGGSQARGGGSRPAHAPQERAQRAPPPPRVREESPIEKERRENRERADKQKQIRDLVEAGEVTDRGAGVFHYRTRRKELRRMYLTAPQEQGLQSGDLAIVDRPNGNDRPHALVSREVAEQVLALDEKCIRFWAKSPTESFGFDDDAPTAAEQASSTEATAADEEKVAEVAAEPAESAEAAATAEAAETVEAAQTTEPVEPAAP